eukprot:CAMPEP_0119308088 /NCGR_PEP_ID=MMETSP1333-20130426/8398_1 /TAXON_ID=418940 /ORGANISM="Scyphosphaera apsteinii, Strain RCC1455" /LENGTH=346 /DNA_ID=CAMNT_0007311783 /DNA_START=28 /DNA_END=1069 /DNA_ORIENTATION=-
MKDARHANISSAAWLRQRPITLAVMVLTGPPTYSSKATIDWAAAAYSVGLLYYSSDDCHMEDRNNSKFPMMHNPLSRFWIEEKSDNWWCAQRSHLRGLKRLLAAFPGSDWYLLADADTLVFPHALRVLLVALDYLLSATEELFTGHIQLTPVKHSTAYIGSGGGCLIRGGTLRRLNSSGVLGSFMARQRAGDLRWQPLDWTLAEAMNSIGIKPRGHAAFQHMSPDNWPRDSWCDTSRVACHLEKASKQEAEAILGLQSSMGLAAWAAKPESAAGNGRNLVALGRIPVTGASLSVAICLSPKPKRLSKSAFGGTPESLAGDGIPSVEDGAITSSIFVIETSAPRESY